MIEFLAGVVIRWPVVVSIFRKKVLNSTLAECYFFCFHSSLRRLKIAVPLQCEISHSRGVEIS